MKRSLILLGLSILTLLGVMVGQVYAGSRIDALFVFPNPAYIHDGNHVDFDWYPDEGVADRVSVRHRSSYEGSSSNLPPTETLVLTAHDRDAFGSAKLTAGLVEMEAEAAGFIIIKV